MKITKVLAVALQIVDAAAYGSLGMWWIAGLWVLGAGVVWRWLPDE
jgi:hypothetical protein